MHWWASIAGIVLIFIILMDAFETVVLPRRIKRIFRITAGLPENLAPLDRRGTAHRVREPARRLPRILWSAVAVPAARFWALGLIFGFACVQYGLGEHLSLANENITFGKVVYLSGETFFTLGYGDITPNNSTARALAVMEAGMGFASLES